MIDEKSKQIKKKLERFVMLQEDDDIAKVENLARQSGCTKSWVYRALLNALLKKYPAQLPDDIVIKRPRKFIKAFRQTTVCFYGDRGKWFSLCRIWQVELGPLIRFALTLFKNGDLELDLENVNTIKEIRKSKIGRVNKIKFQNKINGCIYLYQNINTLFRYSEYWDKNWKGNLFLMKWGLNNRKKPLLLSKNFTIENCFK